MTGLPIAPSRRTSTGILLVSILLTLSVLSCRRRHSPPPSPPPPDYLALGDAAFEAGDSANAHAHYLKFLQEEPSGMGRDRALFRAALATTIPSSPDDNAGQGASQGTGHLNQLLEQYPLSPYAPEAQLILDYQRETARLRARVQDYQQSTRELSQELEQLRTVELERLRSEIDGREERIRNLTRELDRLKRIDMQRRPSSPSR